MHAVEFETISKMALSKFLRPIVSLRPGRCADDE